MAIYSGLPIAICTHYSALKKKLNILQISKYTLAHITYYVGFTTYWLFVFFLQAYMDWKSY